MGVRDRTKKRSSSVDLSAMMYGKVPPQARELEDAVLGAIMLEKNALSLVKEVLKHPEAFYVDAHQRIFKAFLDMDAAENPIDLLTVVEYLKATEELDRVGGMYYLTRLTNSVVSSANIVVHARILLQKFIQRELIRMCGDMIGIAYEDSTDVFDLVDQANSIMSEVEIKMQDTKELHLRTLVEEASNDFHRKLNYAEKNMKDPDEVLTGNPALNELIGSFRPGNMYGIGGRPAMGKTAYGVDLANDFASQGIPTGVGTAEMSGKQLVLRSASNIDGLSNTFYALPGKLLTKEHVARIDKALYKVPDLPLYIDDGNIASRVIAKIGLWVRKYGLKVFIGDYLQKFKCTAEEIHQHKLSTPESQVAYVSELFRRAAKKYNIIIIMLFQFNREVEKRTGNKEPKLSDIRDSGSIEQDMYFIAALHRPEYYEIYEDDNGYTKGKCYFIILKNREGPTGRVAYRANLDTYDFLPWEDDDPYQPLLSQQNANRAGNYDEKGKAMFYFQKKYNTDNFDEGMPEQKDF